MTYIVVAIVVTVAVAVVIWPLIWRERAPTQLADDAVLETAIKRYRTALKRGTVCERCLRDNPERAKYCSECGKKLDPTEEQ